MHACIDSVWFSSRLFSSLTEATVELSLDSPRDERKKDAAAKPSVSTASSSLSAAASLTKPQSAALEEVHTRLTPE